MTGDSYTFLKEAAGALLVLLLLIPVAYLATRAYAVRARRGVLSRAMQVLEVASLGPGRSLCLVRVGERLFVLGVTAHTISLVAEITETEEIASVTQQMERSRPGAFAELLKARVARERQGEDKK